MVTKTFSKISKR